MLTITCRFVVIYVLGLAAALAQSPAAASPDVSTASSTGPKKAEPDRPVNNRVFGVMANYRTTDASSEYHPLTTGQKFYIASMDSFDWPGYLVGGAFAAVYQLEDSNPSFGQGTRGYAKRYLAAFTDQVAGNMMTEAVLPTLLREDPRYFRIGKGSGWKRLSYAATRIFVTRTDSGGSRFNTSEVLGNAITASLANAYYADNRGFGSTMQRLYTQLAMDSFSNVMKELWPDIKRKLFHK